MAMDERENDEQLLRRAAGAGDRAAMDELIPRYANFVHGIAQRQTGDAHAAADVSQAVFVVFVRRVRTIRHARALPGWFLQTTRYAVKAARRAANRRAHHERRAAKPERIMGSQTTMESNEDLARIDEAIASLGKTDRSLVLMRYLQGREVEAIAATLGVSEVAARKRLTRAVERMRAFYAKRG